MDQSTEELLEIIRFTEIVSAELHGLSSAQEIFRTVTDLFRKSKRFNAHIMLLDEDQEDLRFVSTSFAPRIVSLGERIAGVSMDAFRIPLDRAPLFSRVVLNDEAIRVDTMAALEELLPSSVVPAILRRIRYEGTGDILTPLHRGGRTIGIFSFTAPGLAEHFIPSLRNLAHHIGAALDVAEAQEESARVQQQYQDMLENLNEIFYTVDATGRLTYISPNAAETGFASDKLIGRSFTEIFQGTDADAVRSRFQRYLTGELRSGESEYRLRDKSGRTRWIRISSRAALEDGVPVGLRGSIVDVTDARNAEEALRESERILNQTGRMAKIGGWEHDLETGEAIWTEELYRIIEIDPAQRPPGAHEHLDYYPPEDRNRLSAAYDLAVKDGTPFDLELRCRTETGRLRWVRAYGEPVIEEGKCVKMRGTFQDITDRKMTELAKVESERQLSTLMANLPGMAYRCRNERDWTMEFASEGCRAVTGYAAEDLIESRAVSYGSLIHPDDRERVWVEVQDAVGSRHQFELEYRLLATDGSETWVREQGQAVFSEEGEVVALEGFISDVTGQRCAEEALRANEERFSLAVEATSDGLWDWDITSGGAYFSPRYYTMLGYEPDEFPAGFDMWTSLLHPEDRERVLRTIRDHIARKNDTFEVEFRMQTKDSSWRWILSRGRVVERNTDGRPLRMVGTHTDFTARKEDAAALESALDGTIRAIARTAEERDPYTAGHQERVAQLSCAIVREIGQTETMLRALHVAGLLHDVGKIAVPSEILSKPSRLTEAEMQLVRGHPEASFRILEGIGFRWPVAQMILQHHERLDGTGYPQGLSGDDICLGARILAVADVVEAIASHRPYRPALGIDAALEEIERGCGAQYDGDVVAACLRLFREQGLTFDTLPPSVCEPEA